MTATKTTIVRKKVYRHPVHKHYVVVEIKADGSQKPVSKNYNHSTSAFAALGRLVQKETA